MMFNISSHRSRCVIYSPLHMWPVWNLHISCLTFRDFKFLSSPGWSSIMVRAWEKIIANKLEKPINKLVKYLLHSFTLLLSFNIISPSFLFRLLDLCRMHWVSLSESHGYSQKTLSQFSNLMVLLQCLRVKLESECFSCFIQAMVQPPHIWSAYW